VTGTAERAGANVDAPAPSWDLSRLLATPLGATTDRLLADARSAAVQAQPVPAADPLTPAAATAALARLEACLTPVRLLDAYSELLAASGTDPGGAERVAVAAGRAWEEISVPAAAVEASLATRGAAELAEVAQLLRATPYHAVVCRLRDGAGMRLADDAEQVLAALAATGVEGWQQLAGSLLGRLRVQVEGSPASFGAALAALHDPDPGLRSRVHAAATQALRPEIELRATVLVMIVRDLHTRASLRDQADWLAERHLADQVDGSEMTQLLETATEHAGLAHRYFAVKGRLLGTDTLLDADRYAPVGREPVGTLTWSEAYELALDTFADIHPDLVGTVLDLVSGGCVDAVPRPGKRPGASTRATIPGLRPYARLEFTGRLHDALSLVHELGHAVHFTLSGGNSLLTATPAPVVAETFAIFCEELAVARLLRSVPDPAERLSLQARQLEGQLIMAVRQAALAGFEADVHDLVAAGETPGRAELDECWMRRQATLYGPSARLTEDFRPWWSGVSDLFLEPGSRSGYVYGAVAAHALLMRFTESPHRLRPGLLAMLTAGSTAPPADLLARVGLGTPAELWRAGFSAFDLMLASLLSDARVHLDGGILADEATR
jgi:oligoendopeptidase F